MTGVATQNAAPSLMPVPKIQTSAVAGALVTIAIYVLGIVKPELAISAEVASAATTLLSVFVGYMTPPQGFGR